ncbi:glycosyltransferase family 2 protein [Oxobacter pfennigii]|nr:glycosyltransferase family 2 protein [Oxobacter pfennigii]
MLTYNREAFVPRAIESVLAQTLIDFEFIIIDNGSTDSSGKIADDYSKKDSRIRVIHRTGGNIGSGRNAGLDIASGDYIAFIDDDDYCETDFLEFLYNLAKTHNADIATCGSRKEENGNVSPNGIYEYDELHIMSTETAMENFIWRKLYNCAMPTKMVRRDLFNKGTFLETGKYDDVSTTYKYFVNAKRVVAYGLPKYTFYRHDGNNSNAATKHHLLNSEQLFEYLKAYNERTLYIAEHLPSLIPLARYSEWSYMLSMIEKINKFKLTNCNEPLEFMKKEIHKNLDEFLGGGFILKFEKEWVSRYLL